MQKAEYSNFYEGERSTHLNITSGSATTGFSSGLYTNKENTHHLKYTGRLPHSFSRIFSLLCACDALFALYLQRSTKSCKEIVMLIFAPNNITPYKKPGSITIHKIPRIFDSNIQSAKCNRVYRKLYLVENKFPYLPDTYFTNILVTLTRHMQVSIKCERQLVSKSFLLLHILRRTMEYLRIFLIITIWQLVIV